MGRCMCMRTRAQVPTRDKFPLLTFEASLPGRPAPEAGASASVSAAVAAARRKRLPYGQVTSQLLAEPLCISYAAAPTVCLGVPSR